MSGELIFKNSLPQWNIPQKTSSKRRERKQPRSSSTREETNKQIRPHNEILLSNQNKQTTDLYNSLDESQMQSAK